MTSRITDRDVKVIVLVAILAMVAKVIWPEQREFIAGQAGFVSGYIIRRAL